ncbi:TonB-dependent receptor [Dysgonomonas sp. ZJ709]|uniref:TonB-dependent receptor n=1 Tax=Dysgonomonas sp. ZJ709 TaxID=2709797 RepID=UPI0013EC9950|nr:TonB-dependent receptor [Dysgonomonas sp. ZJ709]
MININRFSIKCANTRRLFKILRVIFFTFFISISACYASNSYAQNALLTLEIKNKPIKEIFSEIEKNSEYVFFYYDEILDGNKKVSVSIHNEPVNKVLDEVFKDTDNTYRISDKQIFVSRRASVSVNNIEQQKDRLSIRGNVTDKKGEPLIGVSIVLKSDPKVGTITDIDGNYSILVPDRFAVLQYKYIGFIQRDEEVGNRKIINIVLEEDIGQLEEVVVVGYGSQKKASVVGAISTMEPSKLQTGTTRSLSNNLAGNVGGIIGAQRSGEPGNDHSDYWIRGISTFVGGNARKPLVLIDGVERSLDNIDVEEIESFSVLKDASATAVYGVRGANGVILITTKRGKAGRTNVRVNVEHGITEPVQVPEFLGAADYMQLLNDISTQNGGNVMFDPRRIENTRLGVDPDLYPDVNWLKAISNDRGSNTRASVDISGGTERLRYAFVTAYYHENGMLKRDEDQEWNSSLRLDRYNVRSNVDLDVTSTTLLRVNMGGYLQKRVSPPGSIDDLFKDAFRTPPFVHPTRYSSGQIPKVPEQTNPWAIATQRGYERDSQSKLETLISVDQDLKDILPGLRAKVTFAFDNFSRNGVKRSKDPDYYAVATGRDPETGALQTIITSYGQEFLGQEQIKHWGDNSTYLEGNITYNRTFASKHAVDALLLYNQRDYDNGDKLPYRNQGFAGRLSYTLSGRYIAEFNFGYNGSENFAKGQRYGFFPSIAAGWIMSEEPFMRPLNKTFSKIKFRISHGLVGNDQLDGRRFAYITTISDGGGNDGYYWGNFADFHRNGKWEGDIGVPGLTWETVTKTNLGLELGLWNMLELQVDYFDEKRRDIFMQRKNFPNSAGFAKLPWANFGKVDNKGIDLTLDVNKRINKDWFISVRGTLTYAKNKIIEQDEDMGVIGTNRSSTGLPVGQIFGLIAEGLFTEQDFADVAEGQLAEGIPVHTFGSVRPGDIKYRDVNGDGVVDSKDRSPIGGTVDPQLIYGFGLNMNYKNLDFGFLFQGSGKTYRTIGRGAFFLPGSTQGATGNIYSNAYDRWTPENPSQDAFYPRLSIGSNANNSQESSWWLRDMSMMRLKNLEIGYSFPRKMLRKAAMQNARIFARGTNLFCLSDFKLWDPELNTPDDNGLRYSIMRSYSIGLQVSF